MTKNARPSREPSKSSGSIPAGTKELYMKFLKTEIDNRLPAKVIAFDRSTNRATVQPLIAVVTTENEHVSRNQLSSIPVFNIGGGNAVLTFNLNPGDLGWIQASDRDIADFLKTYKESVPSTERVHDFNNGVFMPDVMTGWTINEEDAGNAVLQTLDGTVRVSLFPGKLKFSAPRIELDTTGNIVMNCEVFSCSVNDSIFLNGKVLLNDGGSLKAIARVGDSVSGGGVITTGSPNHKAD